ncbi:Pimeloyl-ACP methyl ester carboxylesterase [Lentzea waywayandensis]|uniref:Pimeloyl-ACP methyl ester carboxylesterase n=1 Tax=Lentzea waywayandensis TaxID=84724 RepID=A0A1I6FEZ9_9PSEU|nr:alpha/beta fold hydrolase [Lentzea waywayandensis]SFR28529.1 Pimeloyl-ACP methyl ester carboxylesterase [Lentzea waywayandensis]
MALVPLNGIELNVQTEGSGDLVVLVMGTGSPGRVWRTYQVPALVKAGYRVAYFDNRGIRPSSECAGGFTLDDMVADTAALIEHLGGPAHVIGTSLGGRITQELALTRPSLVRSAVMMATAGRPEPVQQAWSQALCDLHDKGVEIPLSFYSVASVVRNLSQTTLTDPMIARDWLQMYEFAGSSLGAGERIQLGLGEYDTRLDAYRAIAVRSLVIGFADDLVLPPRLSREVADAIPGARYAEVADAGHVGYLERPDEVNRLLVEFLGGA